MSICKGHMVSRLLQLQQAYHPAALGQRIIPLVRPDRLPTNPNLLAINDVQTITSFQSAGFVKAQVSRGSSCLF